MEVKFTDEQQAVIDARDCNLLVSAAAGSGKTAVLVERIIQLICSDLDVDHLLVVTFTKAAASQMKEKITAAIRKKLSMEPENTHLQRQETLIHNAQITTIDSFCQYVIRNDFSAIGLDPSFRVGDEGELKLIREDVMTELLEKEYAAGEGDADSDFLFCMDYFSTGSRDRKVEDYIGQLYNFSMSMPFPEDWIRERAGDYDIGDVPFDELPWVKECVESARRTISECAAKISICISLCNEPDGPYMYGDVLDADKDSICAALRYDSYDALFDGIRTISFARLPSKKDDSVSADKREYVKNLRQDVKESIDDLREKYFALTAGTIIEQMKLCDRAVKELCRLTMKFKEGFDEKKRSLQLIDFSDMEHFALQILVNHPSADECAGKTAAEILMACTPSATALEYRDYYREVLIDEYQDSNNVQEMILKAISGEEAGASERFMVGDVKQSIYKFRLARPEIFMEKLHAYDKSFDAKDRRIDLHKNFRSRSQVLSATNYIFRRIMGSDLGGVDYDRDAELVCGASYDEPAFDVTPELIMLDGKSVLENGDEDEYISGLSDKEKEALLIAQRIQQLRAENKDLMYKDIVILLRSLSGWDDVFKDVLEDQGIPTYIDSKSGYFDSPEVAVLLNMLSVIDNPTQDIPLVSVMHSPLGGFSDEELALIRIAINGAEVDTLSDSLYEGMSKGLGLGEASAEGISSVPGLAETSSEGISERPELGEASAEEMSKSPGLTDSLAKGKKADDANPYALDEKNCKSPDLPAELLRKVASFIQMIEEFRDLSTYTPVHELLQLIIDRTGFDMIVTAQPSGNQRRANIEMLLERAANFEKTSFRGLFHFVRYIEHIRVVRVDYGEAGTIDENADVVRIMSIHKSKGLEFPVVFVSGLSKEFNRMDLRGDLVCDMDLGIGTKCIDSKQRVKYDTLKRRIITDKMGNDNLGEEIRVLYVALTRAKEKLILTAFVGDLFKTLSAELKNLQMIMGDGDSKSREERVIPFFLRQGASGYFTLVLRALLPHPAMRDVLKRYELDFAESERIRRSFDNSSEEDTPEFRMIALGERELKENLIEREVRGLLHREELKTSILKAASRNKSVMGEDRDAAQTSEAQDSETSASEALDVEEKTSEALDVEEKTSEARDSEEQTSEARDSEEQTREAQDSFFDIELADRLNVRFSSKYAYENLRGLFTKTSVSELKKKAYEEEEAFAVKAGFVLESEEEAGAEKAGFVLEPEKEVGAEKAGFVLGAEEEVGAEKAGFMPAEGMMPEMCVDTEPTGTDALKPAIHAESEHDASKPDKHYTGADKGTAYHRVMELLDDEIYGNINLMKAAREEFDESGKEDASVSDERRASANKSSALKAGTDESSNHAGVKDPVSRDASSGSDEQSVSTKALSSRDDGHKNNTTISAGKVSGHKPGRVSIFIRDWIKRKSEDVPMDPETPQMVWTPDVTAFLASDIGQRMGNAFRAGNLMREKPFMMGISASELDPKFPKEEMVLIQGIIDAFFIEDGEAVLIDYKTDRVSDGETLIRRYKKQIELYRRAIEAATGFRVKEAYLYSVALRKAVQIQGYSSHKC